MSDHERVAEARRRLEAVGAATSELLTALRAADPAGMGRALRRRAKAIERLERPLAELRLTADGGSPLLAEKRELDRQAKEAIARCRDASHDIRAMLERTSREGAALKSYRGTPRPAVVLDRSG